MFRPQAATSYVTPQTFDMSHHTHGIAYYTDDNGFRVPAAAYRLSYEHKAGAIRIAVLGGSAVLMGSTWDATLPGSLQRALRAEWPGRDVEVINGGIVSAVSRQSVVELVLTVSAYRPDIVILYDGYNDLFLPLTYESRPNFPYNFQALEDSWNEWRDARQAPLLQVILSRSYVYQLLAHQRSRSGGNRNTSAGAAQGFYMGANALRPEELIANPALVRQHVSAYLSNWRILMSLAAALHYRAVCVLQPTAGLDAAFATKYIADGFGMQRPEAERWVNAFELMYEEADRQVNDLRHEYPNVPVISMKGQLLPARAYFWDLVHVYDEVNMTIARQLSTKIRPTIEVLNR